MILDFLLNLSVAHHNFKEPVTLLLWLLRIKYDGIFIVFLARQDREIPCVLVYVTYHEHIISLQKFFSQWVEVKWWTFEIEWIWVLGSCFSRSKIWISSLIRIELFKTRFGITWVRGDVFYRISRTQQSCWVFRVINSSSFFF